MSNPSSLPYRLNVAAFVTNKDGKILLCRRADKYADWQLPQGGIDEGETSAEALARELQEEIRLTDFRILAECSLRYTYEWPPEIHHRGFRGQEQHFYCVLAPEGWTPTFDHHTEIEFDDFTWVSVSEFRKIVSGSFREASYIAALQSLIDEHKLFLVE